MSIFKSSIKNAIRDLIPSQFQVPLKYYYNTFQSKIEPEMRLLKYLVSKNDCVIDVGGNRGVYTYKLWKLGAKIEVFEPNPTCLQVLKPWVAKKPDVNLHPVGLSNSEGSVNLHIPIDADGIEHDASATIEDTNFKESRDQLVSIKTLDGYQFQNVSFIKIDVEGHESQVIEGAQLLLKTSKPALLVEIEQRHNNQSVGEVFQQVLKLGYSGFFLDQNKIIGIEKFDVSEYQSLANFEKSQGQYINNFLFLCEKKLAEGCYDDLVAVFKL